MQDLLSASPLRLGDGFETKFRGNRLAWPFTNNYFPHFSFLYSTYICSPCCWFHQAVPKHTETRFNAPNEGSTFLKFHRPLLFPATLPACCHSLLGPVQCVRPWRQCQALWVPSPSPTRLLLIRAWRRADLSCVWVRRGWLLLASGGQKSLASCSSKTKHERQHQQSASLLHFSSGMSCECESCGAFSRKGQS